MPFVSVFGGSTIYPSDTSYLLLTVSADVQLQWPIEQAIAGANIVADIVDLNPTGPGFNVDLPDARQVATGYTALFNNVGGDTVTIRGSTGATLVSLTSGTVWQLYLTDNSTAAGTWRVFQYGASVSVNNAAALAGAGLKAIGTTLNQSIPNRNESSTPVNIVNSDRAMLIIWTGGLGDLNLPNPATVGSDWFIQIRNSGSGNLTVIPAAGTIDDAANKVFAAGTSAVIVTDGSEYYTIGFGNGAGGGGSSFDFVSINVAGSGNFTLAGAQLNRIGYEFTGVLTGDRDIIVPNSIQQYWVTNSTTGPFSLVIRTVAQAPGIEVLQNNAAILYCNGTDVVDAESSTITFPIAVSLGGTGAVNATNARSNLGLSYANPSAQVGPVAVNGATGTVMDAGSAPAINLGATYAWTGPHTFSQAANGAWAAVGTNAAAAGIRTFWGNLNASVDNRYFGFRVNENGDIRIGTYADADFPAGIETSIALSINRTGTTIDLIDLNATGLRWNASSLVNLAANPIWLGAHSFTFTDATRVGPVVTNINPGIDFIETGVAANNGVWRQVVNGEQLQFQAVNDALNSASQWLTIDRTGITIDTINFGGTTLSFNGIEVSLKAFTVNSQSANYTLVAADAGDLILHPNGAGAGDTITIPANASVAFPIGTVLTFVNRDTNSVTIAITSDTLIFAGSTSTGSRTLGPNGIATAVKIESTTWLISGVSLV